MKTLSTFLLLLCQLIFLANPVLASQENISQQPSPVHPWTFQNNQRRPALQIAQIQAQIKTTPTVSDPEVILKRLEIANQIPQEVTVVAIAVKLAPNKGAATFKPAHADPEVGHSLNAAVQQKHAAHGIAQPGFEPPQRAMYQIGG